MMQETMKEDTTHSVSSGAGSMPKQTRDIFVLEQLEDVGRTAELAESHRTALHAVADWIEEFVVRPHEDLGRAGGESAVHALAEELRRLPWRARRD